MTDVEFAHDDEPAETLILLQRTQDVVNKVFSRFHGREDAAPSEVAEILRQEIAVAGLPEQPAPWVLNTATEIAAGRVVVLDSRTG